MAPEKWLTPWITTLFRHTTCVNTQLDFSFNNSGRLTKRINYFRYRDVEFKLIQSPPEERSDHLLTLVDSEKRDTEHAFRVASEFASAVAWQNGVRTAVWLSLTFTPGAASLRAARPRFSGPPRIELGGIRGCSIERLPSIENTEQREALAMFREAMASNSFYLRFLFMWHVLELLSPASPGKAAQDAVKYVDDTLASPPQCLRIHEVRSDLEDISLGSRSVGEYLRDDCRHAVAHLKRDPLRGRHIDVDDLQDRRRMELSSRIVTEFARCFIEDRLGLRKRVYLEIGRRGAIPVYRPDRWER